jgi:lysozyme
MKRTLRLCAALAGLSLAACGLGDGGGDGETQRHPGIAHGEAAGTPRGALTTCATVATPLEGIDISHYDGAIDWAKVAGSGRKFAFAKATEGVTYLDPQFATNWAGMKQAGLVRGAYHFFRPDDDGTQQAHWFLSKVGTLGPGDLPPVLDWEVRNSGVATDTQMHRVQQFLDEVRAVTGRTTILYTSRSFLTELGVGAQFAAQPLWDANWGVTCPNLPDAWKAWTFWQYSSTGVVPGIASTIPVDLNKFNGTLAQLTALAAPATTGADGGASDAGSDAGADGGARDAGIGDGGLDGGVVFTAAPGGCGSPGAGAGGAWAGLALLLAGLRKRRER